jgi:F-type H+-transporting ATPase subunit b
MQINWAQLLTNILGFLLLFWGLKRFAWGPILGMLDERRTKIAADFKRAEDDRSQAQALREDLEGQLREVEATARKRIEEATTESNRLAAEIKDEARTEARGILDKAKVDIEHEAAKARVQLRDDIVAMAIKGAEKVLREHLDAAEHEKMVNKFIDELESTSNA